MNDNIEIYYENNQGNKIDLNKWPIGLDDITELFSRNWSANDSEVAVSNRTKVNYFYRTNAELSVKALFYADSEEEYANLLNSFNEVTDLDIVNNEAGRLYVNGWYLTCYIKDTSPADYEENFYAIENELSIYSPYPFWVQEERHMYYGSDGGGTESSGGKRYPYDYPYDYLYDDTTNSTGIKVDFYKPVNFKLVINGSVTYPIVRIGENVYSLDVEIAKGEYITIDSRAKTAIWTNIAGQEESVFGYRDKEYDLFAKIPTGTNTVTWNTNFDFELTLYMERSEPEWN